MPNNNSAKKRLKTSEADRQLNAAVRTRVKSARRKLFEAVDEKKTEESQSALKSYTSELDKAAKKGVIAKNTAVRRKTRATEKVRALS